MRPVVLQYCTTTSGVREEARSVPRHRCRPRRSLSADVYRAFPRSRCARWWAPCRAVRCCWPAYWQRCLTGQKRERAPPSRRALGLTHRTPNYAPRTRGRPCLRGNVPALLPVRVVFPELTKPHWRRLCAPRPRWAPSCSSAYATATPPTLRSGGAPTRALRRGASFPSQEVLQSHSPLPVPQGAGASQQLVLRPGRLLRGWL